MTCADEQIGKTLQCSRCAGYFTARPLQLWQVLEQRQRAFETADEPTLQRQENHALREGSPRRKLLLYRQAGAQLDDCGLGAAAQASTGPVERYDLQYEAGYDSRSAKLGCSPELAVVLDDLRSQWNVGAIFRTADCFGWGRLHACGTTPIPPARKLLRVSLGAETSVAWDYHAHVVELIGRLLVDGYVLVALEQTKLSTALHKKVNSRWFWTPMAACPSAFRLGGRRCGSLPRHAGRLVGCLPASRRPPRALPSTPSPSRLITNDSSPVNLGPVQCRIDSDCGSTLTCQRSAPGGVCLGCGLSCPQTMDCVAGACVRSCSNDQQCNAGFRCGGTGKCILRSCDSSNPCPGPYVCSGSGRCERPTCPGGGSCPAPLQCVLDRCVEP
jgi:tRNA G18 (ribose-2'-O)-methylase SpoU